MDRSNLNCSGLSRALETKTSALSNNPKFLPNKPFAPTTNVLDRKFLTCDKGLSTVLVICDKDQIAVRHALALTVRPVEFRALDWEIQSALKFFVELYVEHFSDLSLQTLFAIVLETVFIQL